MAENMSNRRPLRSDAKYSKVTGHDEGITLHP